MEQVGRFKLYSEEEMLDRVLGSTGTPLRDEYEVEVQALEFGKAMREVREQQNLTRKELCKLSGIRQSMLSKIENGHTASMVTISRLFHALKMPVSLKIAGYGEIEI